MSRSWPATTLHRFTERVPRIRRRDGGDADTPPEAKLAARAHRHLITTTDGVWAHYVLDGVDWPMRSPDARDVIRADQQHRWADLTGHRVELWLVTAPYPHRAWARRFYESTPNPKHGFDDMVTAAQRHMLDLAAQRSAAVLAVRVTPDKLAPHMLPHLLSGENLPPIFAKLDPVRRRLRYITEVVTRPGFAAAPMTPAAMRWLMHAMVGLHAPVPAGLSSVDAQGWDVEDVPGFTNPVVATANPYGLTTKLSVVRGSVQHTHHVAVLHVDDFESRDTDRQDQDPYLEWSATLDYPVVMHACFDVVDGADLRGVAQLDRRKAGHIAEHYMEHGEPPPAQIERGIEQAAVVEDEVTNGSREVACRLQGVVMFAVSGPTEEDTLQRCADLTAAAARDQSLRLVHDYGQYGSYRAFTPGEVTPMTGHVSQLPAVFAAAGVPNATSTAGDPTGALLGNIAGSRDVLVIDQFGGTKRNMSNLIAVGSDPGGGKSTLGGYFAYLSVLRDHPALVSDPSGPLARLCDVPVLRPHSRHLSLADASRGVLMPSFMVPEPRLADYADKARHARALDRAKAERVDLLTDSLLGLLPYRMVVADQTGLIDGYVSEAAAKAGGHYGADPWDAVAWLAAQSEPAAKRVAHLLTEAANTTAGMLIFPDRARTVDDTATDQLTGQALLTVVTMEGMVLPPKGTDRATWSRDASLSVPILALVSRLAARTIYANKDPKTVILDELGISTSASAGGGSFTSFAVRLAFDSRKWNASGVLMFQNPSTLLDLDRDVLNLIGAAFVGRMKKDAAISALPLLGLEPDSGYDAAIQRLTPGEFLVRDWRGRVRKTLVDQDWWDRALVAALNTTPTGGDIQDDVSVFEGIL